MHLVRSSDAHSRQGSPRASTELSPLADSHTDRSPSEQALRLALIPRKDPGTHTGQLVLASEPLEEDFEEISYDELRLSLCPADPAHFAPVFGEYALAPDHRTIVMGTRIQTINGPTTPPFCLAHAHLSAD